MRQVELLRPGTTEGQGQIEWLDSEPQILLILVGLPGSGKTTFAEALIQHHLDSNPRKRRWIRASQDDAPSRRRQECEAVTRNALRDGCNVIVDRVGFDAVQRSHFINIADQHQPRPRVYALYLSVSIPNLEERLSLRTIHPTLSDPKLAMMVLKDMSRQLRVPTPEACEGFDKIYTLDESLQPQRGIWQETDIQRVLGLIETEGEAEHGPRRILEAKPPMNGGRGRGYDNSRAGYGARGGRGDEHSYGYRGRGGYGHDRGGGPRQDYGRSWINDREHRPYQQSGPPPHLGPPVGQQAYRPYANINSRPHPYIPPPPQAHPNPPQNGQPFPNR